MIKMMIKTISKITFCIPVIFLFAVYIIVQRLKGNKITDQKSRIYLMNNTALIDFIALLFWGTIVISTVKLCA